jgi:hypothetical protein
VILDVVYISIGWAVDEVAGSRFTQVSDFISGTAGACTNTDAGSDAWACAGASACAGACECAVG